MDDLERTSESPALSTAKPQIARMQMLDAEGAVRLAESFAGTRIHEGDAASALAACRDDASRGARASTILRASSLASAREAMRKIAQSRLGVVVHAMSGHGGEELAALGDVGWGVLVASSPEDSFDLSLVARRAAEDCSVPFVVVHALGHDETGAGRAFAMVAVPHDRPCREFVGASSRLKPHTDPAHPSLAPHGDRAFAERVPFALGSALREYGNVSGRRHDVLDKAPLGEAPLVIIGMGAVGEALLHATAELRARGYDVGSVQVTALRPFPGARLVKTIARALAVTVLEPADEPLASGGVLAREVKSAFTDAITWAPGFPGIGRIPKLFHGVTGHTFDVASLAAICENMLADERGKRSFSLVEREHGLPAQPDVGVSVGPVAMRWVLDDRALAEAALAAAAGVLATTLGLRTHGIVAPAASGVTLDIVASRDHARGGMARRGPRLVLATERTALAAEASGALTPGAVLGVLAAELSDSVRAVAREHRARLVPLAPAASGIDPVDAASAACAGAAVAVAARGHKIAVDGAHLARAVSEHFATRGALHPDVAADRARKAFDATNEALLAADLI